MELEAIPGRIERLEAEQAALTASLLDPALYRDRAGEVAGHKARIAEIESELLASLERWESLEQRRSAG